MSECRKCDIHTVCPEHRAKRDAEAAIAMNVAPLSYRQPGWRNSNKLPRVRSKPVDKVQCESKAGKVRCHGELGHDTEAGGGTKHYAQSVLSDGWTHRWEWDNRGRITKDRWIQQTMF